MNVNESEYDAYVINRAQTIISFFEPQLHTIYFSHLAFKWFTDDHFRLLCMFLIEDAHFILLFGFLLFYFAANADACTMLDFSLLAMRLHFIVEKLKYWRTITCSSFLVFIISIRFTAYTLLSLISLRPHSNDKYQWGIETNYLQNRINYAARWPTVYVRRLVCINRT